MIFVDTNYFLRFLLRDIGTQHREVKKLFYQGANAQVELFTSLVVFFEIYWVLDSFYGKRKAELVEIMTDVLHLQFIYLGERGLLESALSLFAQSALSLEDAYNAVYARSQKASAFATFDKKLLKQFTQLRSWAEAET